MRVGRFVRVSGAVLAFGVGFGAFVACADDDYDVPDPTEAVDVPDTSAGDDAVADNLPGLIQEHLEVEFPDEGWVDRVESIEQSPGRVTVKLGLEYEGDQRAFREACAAVAGFVMKDDRFGIDHVAVHGEEGREVMRSEAGAPQCFPVAT